MKPLASNTMHKRMLSKIIEIRTIKGQKILLAEKIILVRSEKKGTIIQLCDAETIKSPQNLKMFQESLTQPIFFRCHNSFLINCKYVDCFNSKEVLLKGNVRVPVSRSKHQLLKENLIDFELKSSF
jgi:two-component system LytT family response regulator